jgi:ADP-heptose:LPS heptosyltransferase
MSSENRLFYEYAYVTFVVGDFIAFESFLTDKEKANLKEIIFFGNRNNDNDARYHLIKKSIFYNKKIKITMLPRINKKHIGFTRERASLLRSHMSNNLHLANNKYKILIDYRFYNHNDQYKKIIENQNLKNYSFVKQKLCEVDKFKLPQEYISISGWTYDINCNSKRLFDIEDWHETIKILKSNNIKGVILNNQNWYLDKLWFREILKEDCFINLTGETNYFEAIEIVKNSKSFIGIDSSLSIIATQALQEKSIMIKSDNGSLAHRLFNYYYSNLKTKDCLVNQIKLNKFNI